MPKTAAEKPVITGSWHTNATTPTALFLRNYVTIGHLQSSSDVLKATVTITAWRFSIRKTEALVCVL